MDAIILHDKEEEVIGTVLLKEQGDFGEITERWDKYLNELEDENEADIYDFVSKGNYDVCEVLNVEFYQPK
ncbi:MAG: hypothetical protein M0R03_21685 [Novosphingobium sp.]|nr:hypothetical protein [Novosphingobium sp.]